MNASAWSAIGYAFVVTGVGLLFWLPLRKPAAQRPTMEIARILIWIGIRMAVQLILLISGAFIFSENRKQFFFTWLTLYVTLTIYEILRLHQGASKK
jgi:hypothetical protein